MAGVNLAVSHARCVTVQACPVNAVLGLPSRHGRLVGFTSYLMSVSCLQTWMSMWRILLTRSLCCPGYPLPSTASLLARAGGQPVWALKQALQLKPEMLMATSVCPTFLLHCQMFFADVNKLHSMACAMNHCPALEISRQVLHDMSTFTPYLLMVILQSTPDAC